MKLKITITGPKVNDVGYRYFLLGIAMSNRIRMFEAHNMRSSEGQAVMAFADGDEEAIKAFCTQIETERPARSEVSNIVFDDFQGEVMRIGEYAQFCATIQLNKAIPVLLDMRDDLRAVRKNTDLSCDSVGPSGSCICGAPSACPMMRLLAGTIAWAFYSSFERESVK